MGVLVETLCCIENQDILENQNFPHSFSDKSKDFRSSTLNKELLTSNQINFDYSERLNITDVTKLPISTKDIIMQRKGDAFQDYIIIKKLGEGTFGIVYEVKNKNNNAIRAMKVIKKSFLNNLEDSEIKKEIDILKKLNHPYIMKIYEYYINSDSVIIISELCEEGDLVSKINKIGKFPEFIVKIIMFQIFKALMYLNQKHIIHGDLKLENILVVCYDKDKDKDIKKTKNSDRFINAINHDMNIVLGEKNNIRNSYMNNNNIISSDEKIKRTFV